MSTQEQRRNTLDAAITHYVEDKRAAGSTASRSARVLRMLLIEDGYLNDIPDLTKPPVYLPEIFSAIQEVHEFVQRLDEAGLWRGQEAEREAIRRQTALCDIRGAEHSRLQEARRRFCGEQGYNPDMPPSDVKYPPEACADNYPGGVFPYSTELELERAVQAYTEACAWKWPDDQSQEGFWFGYCPPDSAQWRSRFFESASGYARRKYRKRRK